MLDEKQIEKLMQEADKVRLVYVGYEKFNAYDGLTKLGETGCCSFPFYLPAGINLEDSCKIISYLSEKVERELNLEPASIKSVMAVSGILEDYGFEKIEHYKPNRYHSTSVYTAYMPIRINSTGYKPIPGVTDLITYGGHEKQFKKSTHGENYFDWFTENVSKDEIFDIYENAIDHVMNSTFDNIETLTKAFANINCDLNDEPTA